MKCSCSAEEIIKNNIGNVCGIDGCGDHVESSSGGPTGEIKQKKVL